MEKERAEQIREALFGELKGLSAGHEPIDLVEDIAILESFINDYSRARIEEARSAGASWSEIAKKLNVSKQAVHKRFTAKPYTPKFAALEFRFEFGKRKKDAPPG